MLKLTNVWVHYGRVPAVQDLTVEVNEGEFVGIVGHNGAGKTTTLGAIAGLLKPTSGQIELNGESISGLAPDVILRKGISLVPENRRIFGTLSVSENLRIGTSGRRDRGEAQRDIDNVLRRFPVLEEFADHPGGKLSGGQQQMLAIGRALVSRPTLLLLDEPTLGLAPMMVDNVFEILEGLREEGVTILLVEQNAARTIEVADRSYVLRSGGRIELEGTAEELRERGDFVGAYLGLGKGHAT